MATVAQTLNKYLKSLFNVEHAVYRKFIADVDGVPEIVIDKPTDFNNGAVASMLEWIRQLHLCLLEQLSLETATGKFLDLIIHNHIGIVRYEGETDDDFRARARNFIIAAKVSRASIIFYTTPYSSPGPPQLLDAGDSAFADVSFSDSYTTFQLVAPANQLGWFVLPAIATSGEGSAFFFVLRLENTPDDEIAEVIDIVNRWKAAGINYEIQIVTI